MTHLVQVFGNTSLSDCNKHVVNTWHSSAFLYGPRDSPLIGVHSERADQLALAGCRTDLPSHRSVH